MYKKCFFPESAKVVRNGLKGRKQQYRCKGRCRRFFGRWSRSPSLSTNTYHVIIDIGIMKSADRRIFAHGPSRILSARLKNQCFAEILPFTKTMSARPKLPIIRQGCGARTQTSLESGTRRWLRSLVVYCSPDYFSSRNLSEVILVDLSVISPLSFSITFLSSTCSTRRST